MLDDTIAAISTPIGEGALAVIRLSGPQALAIADQAFFPLGKSSSKPSAAASHTVHYGQIQRGGQVIDEVLLTVLRAPRTFTREPMVEISCHGGILTAKLVLDTLLEQGARLALPGEFTRRAFLHGRIDLTQAEAVADLIAARTELAMNAAQAQLSGKLSARINQARDELMRTLAHVEAHIDFPDEDIEPETVALLAARLRSAAAFLAGLLATAREGRILRQGVRAAISGKPNVGKSSLLNQLLGHDRAIVSPIPGTTRDTIEETASIRGIPIRFIDTAGLREAGDLIESEGIRRSRKTVAEAELILHVFDAQESWSAQDEEHLRRVGRKKSILVRNKIDLPHPLLAPAELGAPVVDVSALTGEGIEALKTEIKQLIWSGKADGEMVEVMINSRHQNALQRTSTALAAALAALEANEGLEIVAMELRIATNAVGEIVGKTTTEDLLDSIFSQFCLGK